MKPLNIGVEAARKKIRQYCAYQERCHREVKDKLFDMGLYPAEVEGLLSELISDNFLNEERFAIAFAGGKFRMKQWGKVKIRQELKLRSVSEYCIRKGLSSIDMEDYLKVLEKIAERKASSLQGNAFFKKGKLTQYLLQKGFEMEWVSLVVKKYLG